MDQPHKIILANAPGKFDESLEGHIFCHVGCKVRLCTFAHQALRAAFIRPQAVD